MADETAGASDEGARPTGLSSPRVRLGLLIAGILVLLSGRNHGVVFPRIV